MNRISQKRLAEYGGKVPRSTIRRKPPQKQPVRLVSDSTREGGFREVCSAAELLSRKKLKIEEQRGLCGICWLALPQDLSRIELDHIEPRGMGGAERDDSWHNLQATHFLCNRQKGSVRGDDRLLFIGPYYAYLEGPLCFCGKDKKSNQPTCLDCFQRLPGQLQHDLNTLRNREHAAALVEAKHIICSSPEAA